MSRHSLQKVAASVIRGIVNVDCSRNWDDYVSDKKAPRESLGFCLHRFIELGPKEIESSQWSSKKWYPDFGLWAYFFPMDEKSMWNPRWRNLNSVFLAFRGIP